MLPEAREQFYAWLSVGLTAAAALAFSYAGMLALMGSKGDDVASAAIGGILFGFPAFMLHALLRRY